MTLPTGYRAWLSSIEDDVRVRDLTEDEIAGLIAAVRPAHDMAAVVEVLEWYGEQARLCRLIHSEGDEGRHNLQADGGNKASAALQSLRDAS